MALLNLKDHSQTRDKLAQWLGDVVPDARDISIDGLSTPESGFSAESLFFTASWEGTEGRRQISAIARFAPSGATLFPDSDFVAQYRVLEALGGTAVAVPRVLWLEERAEIFGAPFFVMERVDGRVPVDAPVYTSEGWVLELTPAQRTQMFAAGIEVMAMVHATDWRGLGLGFLARPELGRSPLDQLLRYTEDYYAWARLDDRPHPVIDQAFAWIRENRPEEEPELVLNWGDARPGNIIFAADHSVAAVLDWELAFIGTREFDLAWWIFTQQVFSEGYGVSLPSGIPEAEGTVRRYCELTGYVPVALDWHVRFAGLRSAIMMVRYVTVMIQAGVVPDDTTMMHDNPVNQMLAKVMDLDWGVRGVNVLQRR